MAHHSASIRPGRKPLKDWAPAPEEQTKIEAMLAKCRKNAEGNQAAPAPSDAVCPAPVASGSLPNRLDPALGLKQADACESAETESPAPQLVWNRTGTHEMTSGCQTYKVRKQTIEHLMTEKGKTTATHAWRYQCHVRVQWLWYISLGPLQESFAAAQEVCERHHATPAKSTESGLSQ